MVQSFFHTVTHWIARKMDQNRISNKKYCLDHHLLMKKTVLQLLLPVSVASFLISYTCTRFSVLSSYHFMTTLVCPFFTHVFERKYMFLICNGILAFLMKTLNLNNNNNVSPCSYSLSDGDDVILSSSENFEDAVDEDDHEEEEEVCATSREAEDEVEAENDDDEEVMEAEESFFSEHVLGDFVIESTEGFDDVDYEEEEYIGGEGLMGDEEEEEEMEVMVDMNTEDLNRKFEEFIRKMKEELRIQEQQQWIIAV